MRLSASETIPTHECGIMEETKTTTQSKMFRKSPSMKAPAPEPRGKIRTCDVCEKDTKHLWDEGEKEYVCLKCRGDTDKDEDYEPKREYTGPRTRGDAINGNKNG